MASGSWKVLMFLNSNIGKRRDVLSCSPRAYPKEPGHPKKDY